MTLQSGDRDPTWSIGVVIPARDAEAYVGEAIESVLVQSVVVAEVVVVDDGSTDGTARIAERFGPPVRCLSQPPTGPAAARNRGVAALTTSLVGFLDADDAWPGESLQVRLSSLRAHPELDAVFGQMQAFASPDLDEADRQRVVVPALAEPGWVIGTMLARRGLFDRVGPLLEARRGGDFIEWMLRARQDGARFEMLPATVLHRRLHARNLGRLAASEMQSDYLRIVRDELARRRAQPTNLTDPGREA